MSEPETTPRRTWHIVAVMNGWRVWCSNGTPGDPAHTHLNDARRELAERNAMERDHAE